MYKTISVANATYQKLNAIAFTLGKPKTQVIDDLVQNFSKNAQVEEQKKLQDFNLFVSRLSKRIKLPKNTKIDTQNMDADFRVLKANGL